MGIKTIFVPLRGDGLGEVLLDHALALGRRTGAHLAVNHCRQRAEDMLPLGSYMNRAMREQLAESAAAMADEEERRVRDLFRDYCERHALDVVEARDPSADGVTVSWHERTGKQPDIISVYGRLADLVAVPRPQPGGAFGQNSLEAAIFSTGRLTLMCPSEARADLGAAIAVAWNGSVEAARAMHMGLPTLKAANKVTVLSAETGEESPLSAAMACEYLRSHDIAAEPLTFRSAKNKVGQGLLSAAAGAGADLMLMGAYGQGRQRELILGGVTRHIIDASDLPVLFTH